MSVVLDTSAILAVLLDERGRGAVEAKWDEAVIAAPNLAEVLSVLSDRGHGAEALEGTRNELRPHVAVFGAREAELAGRLRAVTRGVGLSLGDRACLATAIVLGAPVMTADRAWMGLEVGVAIEVIL